MSSIDDKLNEVLNIVPEILDVAVVEEQTNSQYCNSVWNDI